MGLKRMKRKAYFRGLKFKLECGHTKVEVTSFYKLNMNRLSCLINDYKRKGVWCFKCKATCQPFKYLDTVSIKE